MRTFTNALTGRSVPVPEGSRLESLVEADENWSEVAETKAPAKKAAAKKTAASKSE